MISIIVPALDNIAFCELFSMISLAELLLIYFIVDDNPSVKPEDGSFQANRP